MPMEKTVCELFAGVGGFRVGLERLGTGWNTTWFSQWEPDKVNIFFIMLSFRAYLYYIFCITKSQERINAFAIGVKSVESFGVLRRFACA